MPQSSLPELMSQQTTITDLTAAAAAKVSMVLPVDSTNETTGALETLKLSVGQILALNRTLGNEVPTGTPIPWLGKTLPAGYIREGESFDPLQYPELAQVFPSNTTPWIDGRVLKSSRVNIGSHQADQIKTHNHTASFSGNEMPAHNHNQNSHGHGQDPHSHGTTPHSHGNDPHSHASPASNSTGATDRMIVARAGGYAYDVQSHAVQVGIHNTTVSVHGAYASIWERVATNIENSAGTPSGSVTVNSTGATENRVNSILCFYMFRAR